MNDKFLGFTFYIFVVIKVNSLHDNIFIQYIKKSYHSVNSRQIFTFICIFIKYKKYIIGRKVSSIFNCQVLKYLKEY